MNTFRWRVVQAIAAFILIGVTRFGGSLHAAPQDTSQQPAVPAAAAGAMLTTTAVPVPGGQDGTNFDDLQFDKATRKVLVPAGATGNLAVIDAETHAVTAIGGFSTKPTASGRRGGTTSAIAGAGWWFAIDRSARTVSVVDPKKAAVVGDAPLGGGPDYVRYVAPTNEVWVTEPHDEQIEVFTIAAGDPPKLTSAGAFKIADGPESLVIDATRGRAYTNDEDKNKTEAIDLKTHAIVATWDNGCKDSAAGLVLDEPRGLAFVGCGEGAIAVIDIAHDGAKLAYLKSVEKTDIIAYDPSVSHVYLPGAGSATMAILGVSAKGELSSLGMVTTAEGARCVTFDDRHTLYVCDPKHGQVLIVADPYSASN